MAQLRTALRLTLLKHSNFVQWPPAFIILSFTQSAYSNCWLCLKPLRHRPEQSQPLLAQKLQTELKRLHAEVEQLLFVWLLRAEVVANVPQG